MAAGKLIKRQIPDDLVDDILRVERLPSKSLARFLCLSKKWRSKIWNRISHSTCKEGKVLLISASSIESIDFTEPEIKAVTLLDFPDKGHYPVIGAVNGLVLYLDGENRAMILFNAWTQTRRTIQISHHVTKPLTQLYYVYGFGYEKMNDNYVIVLIDRKNYDVFAWSSKTQNWDTLSSPLHPVLWRSICRPRLSRIGLCVNGSIYWQIKSDILCFDLKAYKFNVIEKPRRSIKIMELVVLGDRLAAVQSIIRESGIKGPRTRVWKLDSQMQWIRIMTIPRFTLSGDAAVRRSHCKAVDSDNSDERATFYELMSPLLQLKNGNFVLVPSFFGSNVNERMILPFMRDRESAEGRFYLYNKKTKFFTKLKTEGIRCIVLYYDVMIPYKNNLFFPMLKEDEDGGRHQLQDHLEMV